MGHDPFTPLAPARVNVLCVPATPITPHRFNTIVQHLHLTSSVIQRTDDAKSQNALSTPTFDQILGTPDKSAEWLLLSFGTDEPAGGEIEQTTFWEPNWKGQVVLGFVDDAGDGRDVDGDVSVYHDGLRVRLEEYVAAHHDGVPSCLVVVDPSEKILHEQIVGLDTSTSNNWQLDRVLQTLAHRSLRAARKFVDATQAELPVARTDVEQRNGAEARSSTTDGVRVSKPPTPQPSSAQVTDTVGKAVAQGLLLLQEGYWANAFNQLQDAARLAKDYTQPAWHARALEGLVGCILLQAWAGHDWHMLQNCLPTVKPSGSSTSAINAVAEINRPLSEKYGKSAVGSWQTLTAVLAGLVAAAIGSHESAVERAELPSLLAVRAKIRLVNVLVEVRRHGSVVNKALLEHLVRRTSSIQSHDVTAPLILRQSQLAEVLIEAANQAQAQLSYPETINVLAAVSQSCGRLGLDRKQGFYLKEVLQKVLPFLQGANQDLGASTAIATSTRTTVQHGKDPTRSVSGISRLLGLTCQVFGISPHSNLEESEDEITRVSRRLALYRGVHGSSDVAAKIEVLRLCILISEAVSDPLATSHFISLLLLVARQTITIMSLVQNSPPVVSLDEQVRLLSGLAGSSKSMQYLTSSSSGAMYWDDFLVRKVTLVEPDEHGRLMIRHSQDLNSATVSGRTTKDPFIYNPFNGQHNQKSGPSVLVRHEVAAFDVVLQNTLETDVEVESIYLVASEDSLQATVHSVMLAPMAAQTFTLRARPTTIGTLKITGCRAKIRYCREQYFAIREEPWKPHRDLKVRSSGSRHSKLEDSEALEIGSPAILELKVVDPLPKLSVVKSSLIQQSLMLLDGQTSTFSITVENSSSLPADFLLFSYTDSHTTRLREALANKSYPTAEVYDLQHQLTLPAIIKRVHPVSALKNTSNTAAIPANTAQDFAFEITGCSGLTQASVLIDYTYLGRPRSEIDGTFCTRRLRCNVNATVNRSIDVTRCNILSLPCGKKGMHMIDTRDEHDRLDAVRTRLHDQDDVVILQLDVRNLWIRPLEIVFQVDHSEIEEEGEVGNGEIDRENNYQRGGHAAACEGTELQHRNEGQEWTIVATHVLNSTDLARLLIPIPRLSVRNSERAIPTLGAGNKQHVVSSSQQLQDESDVELSNREIFWFRQELSRRVRARWSEVESKHDSDSTTSGNMKVDCNSSNVSATRAGEINIRQALRLSPRMVDILRREEVQITFDVKPKSKTDLGSKTRSDSITEPASAATHNFDSEGKFKVLKNEFHNLLVTIRNSSQHALRLFLRLYPSLLAGHHSSSASHDHIHGGNKNGNNTATTTTKFGAGYSDLTNRILFSGTLQSSLRVLKPRETRIFEVGFVAVAEGEYSVTASVEELTAGLVRTTTSSISGSTNGSGSGNNSNSNSKSKGNSNGLSNGDSVEKEARERGNRRIWHSRRGCTITCTDRPDINDEAEEQKHDSRQNAIKETRQRE